MQCRTIHPGAAGKPWPRRTTMTLRIRIGDYVPLPAPWSPRRGRPPCLPHSPACGNKASHDSQTGNHGGLPLRLWAAGGTVEPEGQDLAMGPGRSRRFARVGTDTAYRPSPRCASRCHANTGTFSHTRRPGAGDRRAEPVPAAQFRDNFLRLTPYLADGFLLDSCRRRDSGADRAATCCVPEPATAPMSYVPLWVAAAWRSR
jgi:hypothetical protein